MWRILAGELWGVFGGLKGVTGDSFCSRVSYDGVFFGGFLRSVSGLNTLFNIIVPTGCTICLIALAPLGDKRAESSSWQPALSD